MHIEKIVATIGLDKFKDKIILEYLPGNTIFNLNYQNEVLNLDCRPWRFHEKVPKLRS